MLFQPLMRFRAYGISALLLTCTALHPLPLAAETETETRYLPDSRYNSNLPSPTLLYPERAQPLFPQFAAPSATVPTAPLPEAVTVDSQAPIAQSAPPMMEPAPKMPMVDIPAPTAPKAPAPMPRLLPPPPLPNGAAPQFIPLATIETQRGMAQTQAPNPPPAQAPAALPIAPEMLQRQPLALPEAPPAPPPVAPLSAPPQTLVAPQPLSNSVSSAQGTVDVPEPPAVQEAQAGHLALPQTESDAPTPPTIDAETQAILDRIPRGIDSPRKQSKGSTNLSRFAPDIEGVLDKPETAEDSVTRHESMGVAIEIRQPDLDVTSELQDAYEALASGQPQVALQIYQDILDQSPKHPDAMFGMATTYHRTGAIDKARPYYIELLKINPNHREALINFLSIVAQEAPEEATLRLEYLAKRNPDFSAIPALLGILYKQMDQPEQAIDSMIRAMRMEPENLVYQYNLAIMYDENEMYEDAITLYNRLLAASRSGLTLPAPPRDLQERVIFISEKLGNS